MNSKTYYIYILASGKNGTLYVGVTNHLERRMLEHKTKEADGFTKKYNIDRLVYCEETSYVNNAIAREKQLKKWNRQWKIDLINQTNPSWEDLSKDWFGDRVFKN